MGREGGCNPLFFNSLSLNSSDLFVLLNQRLGKQCFEAQRKIYIGLTFHFFFIIVPSCKDLNVFYIYKIIEIIK